MKIDYKITILMTTTTMMRKIAVSHWIIIMRRKAMAARRVQMALRALVANLKPDFMELITLDKILI